MIKNPNACVMSGENLSFMITLSTYVNLIVQNSQMVCSSSKNRHIF